MENQFTFIQQPEITALQHALQLMPGLQQVDVIWYDKQVGEMRVSRLEETKNELYQLLMQTNTRKNTERFYNELNSIAWFQNIEIPFNDVKEPALKQNLFDELDKNILCVPFKGMQQLPAVIYLFYFRKNASELGPVSSRNILDTSHKQVLGRLISNSMKAVLSQLISNRESMMDYNRRISAMLQLKESKISELEQQMQHFKNHLDQILNAILLETVPLDSKINLPQSTRDLLYPILHEKMRLKNMLGSAINFAKTFHFDQIGATLELLPEYFDLKIDEEPEYEVETKEIKTPDLYSSHTKSYQFLESLELAARKLVQNGQKLTSVNVGKELQQPVTAAAISDKLKNHAYKIHLLLNQYPENWPLIRNQFRPVINIQEKQAEKKFAS